MRQSISIHIKLCWERSAYAAMPGAHCNMSKVGGMKTSHNRQDWRQDGPQLIVHTVESWVPTGYSQLPGLIRHFPIFPGFYQLIGQFQIIVRVWNQKFNVPIKAESGHRPSHQTDFNWPLLLPPARPSMSGVSYIDGQSQTWGLGSHQSLLGWEASQLPTELWHDWL